LEHPGSLYRHVAYNRIDCRGNRVDDILTSAIRILCLLLWLPCSACALNLSFTWDANTEPDIAGYRVFCREAGQSYDYNNPSWQGTETECTLYGLGEDATYYFVSRAYDVYENEGVDSDELFCEGSSSEYPLGATNLQVEYEGVGLMAITPQANDTADSYGATATLTLSVNVATGDLIVVSAGSFSTCAITGISDDDGNSYTLRDEMEDPVHALTLRQGYVLSATATSSPLVITVTFAAGTEHRSAAVVIYTPDGSETVTLDCAATKYGAAEASPFETDSNSSTTGDDVVAHAAIIINGASALSNHEIPSGVAADAVIADDVRNLTVFYRILSSTVSNIEAEIDSSGAETYAFELLCFKSVAAGGLSIPGFFGATLSPVLPLFKGSNL